MGQGEAILALPFGTRQYYEVMVLQGLSAATFACAAFVPGRHLHASLRASPETSVKQHTQLPFLEGRSVDLSRTPPDILRVIHERPWRAGLEPAREVDITHIPPEHIQGCIPADLVGTFYRNGPGRIRVGSKVYGHWFDGDGLVSAATFAADGSVYFRQKYLKTDKLKAQTKAGESRLEARGVWTQRDSSTGEPGGWRDNIFRIPSNPLNTNVVWIGDKLLALCEGGPPFELDPVTLEVRGVHTFHGKLKSFFSAHPKEDPETGCIYNQGLSLGVSTGLHFMKISPTGHMLQQTSVKIGELFGMHDSCLAGRYYVAFVSPYVSPYSSMVNALLGKHSLGSTYEWQPERGTRVLIFDKETMRLVRDMTIPAVSMYHFINGYELPVHGEAADRGGEGEGVIEIILGQHRSAREAVEKGFANMYTAHFTQDLESEAWRYVIDVASGKLVVSEPLQHAKKSPGFELPTVNPRVLGKPSKYAYVNSLCRNEGLIDSVSKVHLQDGGRFENYVFGANRYAGEPVFVPRYRPQHSSRGRPLDAEDDGYILTLVFDASTATSDLVILDASSPSTRPPVATIPLPAHVPYGFHGSFVHQHTFGLGPPMARAEQGDTWVL